MTVTWRRADDDYEVDALPFRFELKRPDELAELFALVLIDEVNGCLLVL